LRQFAKTGERRSRGRGICGQFFCGVLPDGYRRSNRFFDKVFGKRLCLHRETAPRQILGAIQMQSDYARSAYAEFLAYLVKLSDLYCNLFKRGSTPIEKAAAKIEGVKT
jgi:hypothetical protein